jgi:hypothetical protein
MEKDTTFPNLVINDNKLCLEKTEDNKDIIVTLLQTHTNTYATYKLYSKVDKEHPSSLISYEVLIEEDDEEPLIEQLFIGYYYPQTKFLKVMNPKILLANIFGIFDFKHVSSIFISCYQEKEIDFFYFPQHIEKIIVTNSNIEIVRNISPNIKILDLSYNKLKCLDLNNTNLQVLLLEHNNLSYIINLPKTLTTLDISNNNFYNLPNICELKNLTKFYCDKNKTSLNNIVISNNLVELKLNFSGVTSLQFHNNEITHLEITGNHIKNLFVTSNTEYLNVTANKGITLTLNDKIKYLFASSCELKELPKLPNTLIELWATGNNITLMSTLPVPNKTLEKVVLTNNPIEHEYNILFQKYKNYDL